MNCLCAIYVDRNQGAFLGQMTTFVVRYNVIYRFFPINSQYLMTWGLTALRFTFCSLWCGGVQRIVKRTRWSDDVSRDDLCYHFYRQAKKGVEQRWKIILHHLTKLHAFMGNVANALSIIKKVAMHFQSIQMCSTMHNRCIGLY